MAQALYVTVVAECLHVIDPNFKHITQDELSLKTTIVLNLLKFNDWKPFFIFDGFFTIF